MAPTEQRKFERTTAEQLHFFNDFCREHPELQADKKHVKDPKLLADLWAELAAKLNTMKGPTRTATKWKESLAQWRCQLRSRARKAKADISMTIVEATPPVSPATVTYADTAPSDTTVTNIPSVADIPFAVLLNAAAVPTLDTPLSPSLLTELSQDSSSTESSFIRRQRKKKPRFVRTTQEQLHFYVNYCKTHPGLQAKKFNVKSSKAVKDFWSEVSEKLNAMKGPTRTAIKWKESLSQWKCQLRSRARKAGPPQEDIPSFEELTIKNECLQLEIEDSSMTFVEAPPSAIPSAADVPSAASPNTNAAPSIDTTPLFSSMLAELLQENSSTESSIIRRQRKKNPRFERATPEQFQFYVNYCNTHPGLEAKKFNLKSSKAVKDFWSEVSENLNAMKGPTRSAMKWKKKLSVWKIQLRSRARKAGPPQEDIPSSEEKSLQNIKDCLQQLGLEDSSMTFVEEPPPAIPSAADAPSAASLNANAAPSIDTTPLSPSLLTELSQNSSSTASSIIRRERKKIPKFERTTQEQIKFYVRYCSKHPGLQAKRLNVNSSKAVKNFWREITRNLNAMDGPTRTAIKWKERLSHWRIVLRSRAKARAARILSAGGPPQAHIPSYEEQTNGDITVDCLEDLPQLEVEDISMASAKAPPPVSPAAAETSAGTASSVGPFTAVAPSLDTTPLSACLLSDLSQDSNNTDSSSIRRERKLNPETETEKKPRFVRTTQEQLQFYVKFCSKHPELQAKKLSLNASMAVQDLWKEISENLNAMKGPNRTATEWKKTMSHWKNQLHSRSRKAKAQRMITADGALSPDSEFEQLALKYFDVKTAAGSPVVPALGLQDPTEIQDLASEVSSVVDAEDPLRTASTNKCLSPASTLKPIEGHVSDKASTSSSRSKRVAPKTIHKSSARNRRVTAKTIYSLMLKSFKKQDEKDKLIMAQQRETNAALRQLGQSLVSVSQILKKINDKLDKP